MPVQYIYLPLPEDRENQLVSWNVMFLRLLNVNLEKNMGDLNPKVAQGSFHFKFPFLHLPILSVVFHIFLKIKTSNKKYTIKKGSTYPFHKFKENLSLGSFFILFIFTLSFILWIYSFQRAASVSGDPMLENLELTVHVTVFCQNLFRS
jgi:hypothetical protein